MGNSNELHLEPSFVESCVDIDEWRDKPVLHHYTRDTSLRVSTPTTRWVLAAVAVVCVGVSTLLDSGMSVAQGQTISKNGATGFVVTQFEYSLGDADKAKACPSGLTQGYANIGDVLPNRSELQRGPQETDASYSQRSAKALFGSEQTLCMIPETGAPDRNFHTVVGANVEVPGGIDLDGQVSRADGTVTPQTCGHDDFRGANGERGIDNQFFRVVGCGQSFQPGGQNRDLMTEMLTGSWGILIKMTGVHDLHNDPNVEVSFYENADPIELSATRLPLANGTYTALSDPRFRATTHGRIVDGVLTTDPVDVRFYSVFNTVRTERPLDDARLRVTFAADGGMDGYLAGYTPVQAMYDVQFGFRNGTEISGKPASAALRNTRSVGQAFTFGHYTCQGAYQALLANADGHRDLATGKCTAISTQYHIKAAPAFVVDQLQSGAAPKTDK